MKRRRIEIADPAIPRRVQRRPRLGVRDRLVEISQRGGSETQFSERQPAVGKPIPMARLKTHVDFLTLPASSLARFPFAE